ncbi:odorant receptor 46a-like isoform X2 [Temnothorax curvispinosus]|uniref:Odorant receptor 46a-like isoform X2 n=1 Tax=Temnothorax curvispinosus TaxID=300111 RepID=A0A6J1QE60_9HYME|nr:odorant receptor 46a-like isoform X2 [Temnothorax curvispinosus]
MKTLKFTLVILAIAGCWRPFSWTSLIKHTLYNAYTLLIISLMYSFTFTQFMDAVLNVNNPDDFTNILYTMVTMFAACYKILNLWVNHERFVELIHNLTEGTFKPVVSVEIEIRRKFDKMIQNYAMCYAILIMVTCAGHVLLSLLTNFKKRQLSFRGWVPFDYSSFVIFCFTYAHQYIGVISGSFVNVACDSLIVGLLLHLCCQITILQYRLKGVTNGQNTLSDCVRQHHHIIEYAYATNARFTRIIAIQFVASTFVVCSNLYQLSRTTLNTYFVGIFAYTFCVLVQIFIYCWFGNKLKLMVYKRIFALIKQDFIMRILKLTCTIFMIAGCFRPQSWTSLFKRTIYNVYRLYVISMLYAFTLSQVIDVVMNTDNPNDFTDNLNKSLTVSVSCYKIFIAWLSYKNIAALINYLTEEPFKPLDLGEMKIRRQYDKIIRNNTLRYTILIVTSWMSLILTSLLTDFRHRKLTYRGWIPYDYSSYATFCFTYAVQVLSTFHCIVVNVACDTLLCGFLMHICCQIEILEYRLTKFLCNQFSLGYCIRHHNRIFEFARMVNTRFTQIIGLQFMASTMVTCFNLYQLTKSALGTNHVLTIIYTICMLTQIFIYCWFGNRVKLKSLQLTNSIFQMEWPIVENSVKKSILIIMKRAMTPIEISTIYILNINLDSFVVLLKTSYSVYNVLLQVPE